MEEKLSVLEFFYAVLGCFSWHTFSICKISFWRMALRRITSLTSLSQDVLRIKIGLLHTDLKKQQRKFASVCRTGRRVSRDRASEYSARKEMELAHSLRVKFIFPAVRRKMLPCRQWLGLHCERQGRRTGEALG